MSHVASAEYLKGVLQNDTSEENYSPRTYSKYEASLLYILSSKPAKAIFWDLALNTTKTKSGFILPFPNNCAAKPVSETYLYLYSPLG